MRFDQAPVVGGSKNFLKLKDKETVQGMFRGEPETFHVVWRENKSHVVPEGTPKSQFRFRINFIVKENGAFVSKIFEQGATMYNQLKDLHTEFDLTTTVVKITRSGSGMDTTYSVMPTKAQASPDSLDQMNKVELQDLSPETKPKDPFANLPGVGPGEDEIPF